MDQIARTLSHQWWLFIVEGILAILFGMIAWVWPGLTVLTLAILFRAYVLVGGVFSLVAGVHERRAGHSPWGFLVQGVLGIVTGLILVVWPDISALALLYVIAVWAIVTGLFQVLVAIELRKLIDNEWFLALAGIASICFGALVAFFPGDGAVALVWTIGIYAVLFGVLVIALGIRLHGWGREFTSPTS